MDPKSFIYCFVLFFLNCIINDIPFRDIYKALRWSQNKQKIFELSSYSKYSKVLIDVPNGEKELSTCQGPLKSHSSLTQVCVCACRCWSVLIRHTLWLLLSEQFRL